MDRTTWLRELQRDCEEKYDGYAPLYWEKYGSYSNITHQRFIQKFLDHLSPHSTILDAACGAGRYEPFLLEKGHTVIGVDQSQGMLARAKEKFPMSSIEKSGCKKLHIKKSSMV